MWEFVVNNNLNSFYFKFYIYWDIEAALFNEFTSSELKVTDIYSNLSRMRPNISICIIAPLYGSAEYNNDPYDIIIQKHSMIRKIEEPKIYSKYHNKALELIISLRCFIQWMNYFSA